jgi:hypothetical protein
MHHAEYNSFTTDVYHEMLTYEPFPNNAELNINNIDSNNVAIYKEYQYLVNVQGYEVVEETCR